MKFNSCHIQCAECKRLVQEPLWPGNYLQTLKCFTLFLLSWPASSQDEGGIKWREIILSAMPSVLWSYHTRVPSSRHPTFIFGFDLTNFTLVYIPVYIKFVLGCNCFSSIGLEGDEGNTLWGKNQLQVTQCIWYDDTTFISSYPELEIAEPTGYMVNSWKDVWYCCHVV